jgi:hypothetical protein
MKSHRQCAARRSQIIWSSMEDSLTAPETTPSQKALGLSLAPDRALTSPRLDPPKPRCPPPQESHQQHEQRVYHAGAFRERTPCDRSARPCGGEWMRTERRDRVSSCAPSLSERRRRWPRAWPRDADRPRGADWARRARYALWRSRRAPLIAEDMEGDAIGTAGGVVRGGKTPRRPQRARWARAHLGSRLGLRKQVRPQLMRRQSGCFGDCEHPLSRDAGPIARRGVMNTDGPR